MIYILCGLILQFFVRRAWKKYFSRQSLNSSLQGADGSVMGPGALKIMICSSKHFYHLIPPVKEALELSGHQVTLPNSFDDPMLEERTKAETPEKHPALKGEFLREQGEKVRGVQAILVMNYEKNGQNGYIGGATFLEIYKAFELGKKIYLMNPVPEGIFEDELRGMSPMVIDQDLARIKAA